MQKFRHHDGHSAHSAPPAGANFEHQETTVLTAGEATVAGHPPVRRRLLTVSGLFLSNYAVKVDKHGPELMMRLQSPVREPSLSAVATTKRVAYHLRTKSSNRATDSVPRQHASPSLGAFVTASPFSLLASKTVGPASPPASQAQAIHEATARPPLCHCSVCLAESRQLAARKHQLFSGL